MCGRRKTRYERHLRNMKMPLQSDKSCCLRLLNTGYRTSKTKGMPKPLCLSFAASHHVSDFSRWMLQCCGSFRFECFAMLRLERELKVETAAGQRPAADSALQR